MAHTNAAQCSYNADLWCATVHACTLYKFIDQLHPHCIKQTNSSLHLIQCFQPIEGTHNNFDNSYCFDHKIVTIGPMVLKCAENVHTSFYSVYASFEGFSSIDSKVTKDQATRNN